jgi:hypothetical protein
MATTTPNFGWQVPTSTDLVKDGAVAIETLGDAIDASLVDLKGGTTGQVLSKTSGTDMDFTWVAAGGSGSANVAGKNGVLNSNFSIWQRGTSIAQAGGFSYSADRWVSSRNGFDVGTTMSRQATGDTTNLPFIQYCARVQRNSGTTATTGVFFSQSFENINSTQFMGKAITFSFYARAGANYSSASNALTVKVDTGTGTDQSIINTWSGAASAIGGNQTATLTTTWQRFTYTGTASATGTQIGFYFSYTPVGTAGANDYFEVTGVQLEAASAVSAYSPNTSTQQAELAACQRYYQKTIGSTGYAPMGIGWGVDSTNADFIVFPVTSMRIAPTTATFTSLAMVDGGSPIAVTALNIYHSTTQTVNIRATVSSGITQYRPYFCVANASSSGFLAFDVEL